MKPVETLLQHVAGNTGGHPKICELKSLLLPSPTRAKARPCVSSLWLYRFFWHKLYNTSNFSNKTTIYVATQNILTFSSTSSHKGAGLQAKAAEPLAAAKQEEAESESMASGDEEGDAGVGEQGEESCESPQDSDGEDVVGSSQSGTEKGGSTAHDDASEDDNDDDDETSPSQATTLIAGGVEDSQTFQTPEREKTSEPEDRFSTPVEVPKQFSPNEMCITLLQYISRTHPDIAKYHR